MRRRTLAGTLLKMSREMSDCITTPSQGVLQGIFDSPGVKMTHIQACSVLRRRKQLIEEEAIRVMEKTTDRVTNRDHSLLLLSTVSPSRIAFELALRSMLGADEGMREHIQKQLIRTPLVLAPPPFDPTRPFPPDVTSFEYLSASAIIVLSEYRFAIFPRDSSMIDPDVLIHYLSDGRGNADVRAILLDYGLRPSAKAIAACIDSNNRDIAMEWLGNRLGSPSTIKEILGYLNPSDKDWLVEISGIDISASTTSDGHPSASTTSSKKTRTQELSDLIGGLEDSGVSYVVASLTGKAVQRAEELKKTK